MTKREKNILTKFYEREMKTFKYYKEIEKDVPLDVMERTELMIEIYSELCSK